MTPHIIVSIALTNHVKILKNKDMIIYFKLLSFRGLASSANVRGVAMAHLLRSGR